jgi:hypothetical protein
MFRREQRNFGNDSWESLGSPKRLRADAPALVPFFAAIRHIVDFLSTLPVDAYRKDGDQRTAISLPPLLAELDKPWNIGLGNWIGQWAYGLATGNAVGYINAVTGFGLPADVRWLRFGEWAFDEWSGQWSVNGRPVPRERIVHQPWVVPPGRRLGLSPVEDFAAFWAAGLSAQEYADIKRGGGLPPAHLKNNTQTIEPAAGKIVQDRAAASFASGKPFVTGKDWDLSLTTVPPNQVQFLQVMQLNANQTAAIFGIDPREIGGSATESLTYATDESRSLNRANNMRPYLVRFEQMISRLLPERQYVKLNVDATIRTDLKTQTETIGAEIADGRLSVDEARALKDRSPVPGGDRYNVPVPSAPPAPATRDKGDTP